MKFTVEWCKAALIRALRTAAQVALSMFTLGMAMNEIDWKNVLSVTLVAAVYSLITSVATNLPELEVGSPKDPEGVLVIDESDPDAPFVAVNLGQQRLEDVAQKKQVLLDIVTDTTKAPSKEGSFEV